MNPKPFPQKSRAFAFSADVVLALILVTSLFVFLSAPTQPAAKLEERRVADQFVDDLFVALDHSGFMSNELDVNGYSSTTLQNVYARAKNLLPPSYNVYLTLTRYPVDVDACRTAQDFASCFPDVNVASLNYGTPLTPSASYVHGRRIFLQQQPASQCSATPAPATSSWPFALFPSSEPFSAQFATDVNLTFDVHVSPTGPLTCDQNITITLEISGNTGARKPLDMMLVFDRSGSMSWDGQEDTTDALGVELSPTTAFISDSTSGLRDINIQNYGLPNLVGTYNSPGTARDVDVSGSYAYLADGASGLRIVNVSNPSSPSSTAQLDVGGDAYAVLSQDTTTYVATSSGSTTDQSNTPTSNRDLEIGQNSTNTTAAQSFTPSLDFISGASVYVRRVGNPSGNLLVNLRSSLSGADLATASITAASLTTSYQEIEVDFSTIYPLTSGSTYYLVLTTPTNNASNYYQWGGRNTNGYANGTAYQNSTNQNHDLRFRTHYIPGLISVDTSTKNSPFVVGAASLSSPWRMTLDGTTLYVADGTAGVKVFDVSTNTPAQIGSYNTPGTAYDVWVDGTYAFVSDGSSGLRILDISTPSSPVSVGTYNTPGTAYATRVNNSLAYIADGSSVQVIDVSTPSSPAFVKSYATPYNYRDLEIMNGWGFLAVDNSIEGLMTFDLSLGPKIDQAKVAAQSFLDFNGWDSTNDQIGLVSYSSSSTLDQTLTSTFSLVGSDINALVSNGSTATGDGINTATAELNSARHNPNALKFQILMSDGLTNTGANSGTAAVTAQNNSIIIYTIGFGAEADVSELTNIATITGGKYYSALDQNALIDVYNLIAQEIQLIATDANVIANIPTDINIISDGNGYFTGTNLVFDINTQEPQPWTVDYTILIPCTSPLACTSSLISVPSPGTQFQYTDANGNSITIDWNVFQTQQFDFHDLNLEIVSGNLVGTNNTDLTVKVSSVGNLDTNASSVSFYQSDPSLGNLLTSASVPALCGALTSGCVTSDYTFTQNVPAEGELWAVVNPNQAIPECVYNNQDVLFCYQNPSTQFFTLDYWVWLND